MCGVHRKRSVAQSNVCLERSDIGGQVSKDNNVLPFQRHTGARPLCGKFIAPDDVRELASLMSDGRDALTVVLTPVPVGTVGWEIRTPDEVRQLGIYLFELAARMREGGRAP